MYLKNLKIYEKAGQFRAARLFLCEHHLTVIVICLPLSAHIAPVDS